MRIHAIAAANKLTVTLQSTHMQLLVTADPACGVCAL